MTTMRKIRGTRENPTVSGTTQEGAMRRLRFVAETAVIEEEEEEEEEEEKVIADLTALHKTFTTRAREAQQQQHQNHHQKQQHQQRQHQWRLLRPLHWSMR
jgi:hypothetical protein